LQRRMPCPLCRQVSMLIVEGPSRFEQEHAEAMRCEGDRKAKWAHVRLNGMELEHASPSEKADYGLVLAAVQHNPRTLRYADKKLRKDEGLQKAARMLPMKHQVDRIILSKRFALGEASSDFSTSVLLALRVHEFFKNMTIYNPDTFDKGFCGPKDPKDAVTSPGWPCRGTEDTCAGQLCMADGHPTPKSCWRYSYRWHEKLSSERSVRGFLLQIREFDMEEYRKSGKTEVKLGNGQKLEEQMAESVGLQVFPITQIDIDENKTGVRRSSIDALACEVQNFFTK